MTLVAYVGNRPLQFTLGMDDKDLLKLNKYLDQVFNLEYYLGSAFCSCPDETLPFFIENGSNLCTIQGPPLHKFQLYPDLSGHTENNDYTESFKTILSLCQTDEKFRGGFFRPALLMNFRRDISIEEMLKPDKIALANTMIRVLPRAEPIKLS